MNHRANRTRTTKDKIRRQQKDERERQKRIRDKIAGKPRPRKGLDD